MAFALARPVGSLVAMNGAASFLGALELSDVQRLKGDIRAQRPAPIVHAQLLRKSGRRCVRPGRDRWRKGSGQPDLRVAERRERHELPQRIVDPRVALDGAEWKLAGGCGIGQHAHRRQAGLEACDGRFRQ